MIKKILGNISREFLKSEEKRQQYTKYHQMTKTPGWDIHSSMLIAIGNQISAHMLSEAYTKLSAEEKDIQQRAFFTTKEIVNFLLNPLKGASTSAGIAQHNLQQEAILKGKQPKG